MSTEHESARELLRIRISEQDGRIELNAQRLKRASSVLKQMSPGEREQAEEFGKAMFENGRLVTDDEWLQAIGEAGVPNEKILEIWNKKDELRREDRSPLE